MSTLTSCLAKAGKNISKADREEILAAAQKYRAEGMENHAAAVKAVGDLIAKVDAAIARAQRGEAEPVAKPAEPASLADLHAAVEAAEPLTREHSSAISALQDAMLADAQKALDAGEMPVYRNSRGNLLVTISPSAQNPGKLQLTRYITDRGVIGDSQYNNLETLIQQEALTNWTRLSAAESEDAMQAPLAAEAKYQEARAEAEKAMEPAAPAATHIEPGEKPEAATAPVVAESLKKAAAREERTPAQMRADLLAQIDAAIQKAPESLPDGAMPKFGKVITSAGRKEFEATMPKENGLTARVLIRETGDTGATAWALYPNSDRRAKALDFVSDKVMGEQRVTAYLRGAEWHSGGGPAGHWTFTPKGRPDEWYVTFDVPGDGKFKVLNTAERLQEFREQVATSPAFKVAKKPTMPRTNNAGQAFGVEAGSGSARTAVQGMIEEGDFQAALDYATTKAVALDSLKLTKDDRTKWDAFLKNNPQPTEQGEDEAAPEKEPATASVKETGKAEAVAADRTPPKGAAGTIQDAGEKIGGSRKDRWKERGLAVADLDEMSDSEGAELAVKKNVWVPDYEAIAKESEPVTAAMVKVVYDSLAAKPKQDTPQGRRDYVKAMQAVRKVYGAVKTVEEAKNAYLKLRAELGVIQQQGAGFSDTKNAEARRVMFSVYKGRSDPFTFDYNALARAKSLVKDGFPAIEPWKRRLAVRGFDGAHVTPNGMRIYLEQSAAVGTPLTKEQIEGTIWRVSDLKGKVLGYFTSKEDAEAGAKTIYERDMKGGKDGKPEPERPHLDELTRKGLPQRIDRDVTAQDFVEHFGFRGIEFGNWSAQDERQRILNMAYDGLADLAEIMGVPPKAMSLNGTMGMAFGARGGGRFAAHYEPGKLVINMTKLRGGGSMAHEWAHALDHYFGELDQPDAYKGKARGASGWYDQQQYSGLPVTRHERQADGSYKKTEKMRLANLRPELAAALDRVMTALFSGHISKAEMIREIELGIERTQALADAMDDPKLKKVYENSVTSQKQNLEETRKDAEDKVYPRGKSEYAKEAGKLSGKSENGYWLRPTEMFARAFESWVFDRVVAMGARSDYLVHGVEESRFAGGAYKGNPYPTGKERAAINAAFDKLASTIETKPTDKGVAMFRRSEPSESAREATARQQTVQKIVDAITAKWANAPKVVVVESMQDERVPEAVREADDSQRSQGADEVVHGFHYQGTVYLVAEGISDVEEALTTLAHESLGHYGLRGAFGDRLKPILQQIVAMRKKDVLAKARDYGMPVTDAEVRAELGKGATDEDVRKIINARLLYASEEVLAEMAQDTPTLGFVKRAIAAIRSFLRDTLGLKLELTDDELVRNWILPARGWVVRGEGTGAHRPEATTQFARAGDNAGVGSNKAIGEAFGRMVKQARDDIASVLFNWNGAELTEDGDPIVYMGRDRAFSKGKDGGKLPVKKREFFEWLASDAPMDPKNFDQDEEWKGQIERLRALLPGKAAPDAFAQLNAFKRQMNDKYGVHWQEKATPEEMEENRRLADLGVKNMLGGQFSRTAAGPNPGTSQPLRSQIMQAMNDTFSAPGKLDWWSKTVGTQYNLAQRSPLYKRVFDSVQDFLGDVSLYATEAADLAPKILPKLETWRDIGKKPISAEDNKAVSAPVFEGTLVWARDERGRPAKVEDLRKLAEGMTAEAKAQRMLRAGAISENVLKMWQGLPIEQYEANVATRYDSQMLRAGVVWTDAELREQFKLTDSQIGLYKEFRAAVDKSLTHLAISDMVRFAGKDVTAEARAEALASPDVDAAALILRDSLLEAAQAQPDRNEVLIDTAEKVIEKADRARDLMDHGYAPLSRFGHYTVDAIDENGERVFFGMFETTREAALMARKMKGNFPKATITRGTVSEQEYKLFAGVSPETVELFGELLGLESQGNDAASQAFQTYVKVAKANRSAMKRLIERKGIAGFSEDVGRVLAGFIYSNSRQTSQNLHMGEMTDAAASIPKGQGELKDQATKLVEYVKNPQEEAQAFRGLLFAQFLGGSVASAMVNMLQPVQMTFPYLSQYGGAKKAAAQLTRAYGDVRRKTTGDAALDAAVKRGEEEGWIAPQEVHQLQAQASGAGMLKPGDGTAMGNARATASNAFSRITLAWGKVFSAAEQLNRRATFIAAYRTAVDQGMADPIEFGKKAIAETQGTYNKGNKPNLARGAVGGTIFTFKQYGIAYVELLHRMATQGGPEGKKAALLMLGMLFLMSGAGGLPFAEDVEDVVDGVMQRLGYNFNSKLAKRQFFENLLGKDLGRFAEHGISGLPGSPIDVSGRLGLGNLIPGTGLLVDKEDHTRDVTEFLGAGGDFATRIFKGANQLAQGDVIEAGKLVAPRAATNAAKGLEMYSTGVYKDDRGRKVIDVDGFDALGKALGFQPSGVAQVQEATGAQMRLIAQAKAAEARFADRWAKAVADGDQGELQEVRRDIARYNSANSDAPVTINRSQIIKRIAAMRESKASRIERTAPKEIRAQVRHALETP